MPHQVIGSGLETVAVNRIIDSNGAASTETIQEGSHSEVNAAYNAWTVMAENLNYLATDLSRPKGRLIVRWNDELLARTPTVDSVRMVTNEVEVDSLTPPYMPMTDDGQYGIDDGEGNPTDTEIEEVKSKEQNPATEGTSVKDSWSEGAKRLFILRRKGAVNRTIYAPFLIKQVSASRIYPFALSYSNVGKIILPANIINEMELTFTLRYALPQAIAGDETRHSRYRYGWLKKGYNIDPGAGGIEVLTQEYHWGFWPRDQYEDAT